MKRKVNDYYVEWDNLKDEINQRKHKLSFEQAKYVFADRHCVELYDDLHSTYDEDRYITIGLVDKVLFVVYTERGDTMRLISARFANEKERRFYYGNR